MSDVLSRLAPPAGARPKVRRLGRGPGSGVGKVASRGMKGQKSRKPGNLGKPHFQGGQTPLHRRLPKRGFNVPFPVRTVIVNVGSLERFEAGVRVDESLLRSARLVQGNVDRIKILGEGEITKKLEIVADAFSKSARDKIAAAGGLAVEVVPATRESGASEPPTDDASA